MITAFLRWLFDLKGWVKALALLVGAMMLTRAVDGQARDWIEALCLGAAGLCLLYWWKGDKR
jgi:hypothetical protein